ncbi:low-density lipoprotein receptor class A domain-containing protein 1-like [Colossoma macropomum]|uniref:low-density lipoprotein receptor class A domain-containing protein 1-like n=1 Tax=Colossoma macropomum TaxID=42526 RepID=UPI001864A17E|nr:low-density lipoprotein receptor class A domain-containing protein 1-like [Colossoma macropomum]
MAAGSSPLELRKAAVEGAVGVAVGAVGVAADAAAVERSVFSGLCSAALASLLCHAKFSLLTRDCRTAQNGSGFLCDDRVTCLPPSVLCNGAPDCPDGADERELLCSTVLNLIHIHKFSSPTVFYSPVCSAGDLPENLPSNLIFRCGNPHIWTFIDKRCNRINDCGDCSDEAGVCKCNLLCTKSSCYLWTDARCPPCGGDWWSCTPVDFLYCDCVPRSLCRDGRQHCFDWSDEYICPKT